MRGECDAHGHQRFGNVGSYRWRANWEAINSGQYKGFLKKLLDAGVNPASIMLQYNPVFFHWAFPSEHNGLSDVNFMRINVTIGGKKKSAHKLPKMEAQKEPESKYGWLSPDGRYYHCSYGGHIDLAYEIVGKIEPVIDPEQKLENLGWAKIYRGLDAENLYSIGMGKNKKLTDKQLNMLRINGLDKTIRWNEEKVEKHNEAILKNVAVKQRERRAAINKATEDFVSLIVNCFDGRINEQQARIIWNLAYDKGHSGGAYEINAHLQELLPAFSDFIEKGDNE